MMGERPGRDPGVPPQRHTLPVQVQTSFMPGKKKREGKGTENKESVLTFRTSGNLAGSDRDTLP